jgi:hypothetical protein
VWYCLFRLLRCTFPDDQLVRFDTLINTSPRAPKTCSINGTLRIVGCIDIEAEGV